MGIRAKFKRLSECVCTPLNDESGTTAGTNGFIMQNQGGARKERAFQPLRWPK